MDAQVGDMVVVKWRDARFYPETRRKDSLADIRMAVFESVGYLVSKDNITTIIASEQNDEGEYRDVTLIPTGSIECVTGLSLLPAPSV